MKNTFNLIIFLLQSLLYSWKSILVLILVPVIFLSCIGWVCMEFFKEDAPDQFAEIALVDKDNTMETQYVIQQLLESDHLKRVTKITQIEEKKALQLMEKNEVAAMIVIPEGFSQDVKRGINTPVKVVGNAQRPLQSQLVFYLMESATKFVSAAQSGINTIYHYLEKEHVSSKDLSKEYKNSIVFYSLHVLGRGELFEVKEKQYLFHQSMTTYYVLSFYLLILFIWSFGLLIFLKGQLKQSIKNRLISIGVLTIHERMALFLTITLSVTSLAFLGSIPILLWMQISILRITIFLGILLIVSVISIFFILIDIFVHHDKFYLLTGMFFILIGTIAGGHIIPVVYFPQWVEKISLFTLNSWSLNFVFSIFHDNPAAFSFAGMKILGACFAVFLVVTLLLLFKKSSKRFG